ncbi:MAG: sodium:proton antiporter [Propionibacteriaceae bacterium]|jgi:CPA1 family monovalent cation:H+ antiporter|nr:sodium:proton antiporter [Propionibacteriaceae bacterium]
MHLEHYLIIGVIAVIAIVALSVAGSKLGVAPPLILIVVGIGISLLPFVDPIPIDPQWILVGILPPILYSSAISIPVVEFRRDLVAIGGLAVVLVVATAVILGFVFHAFLPDVPLALCVALGAIVSPTDAVATTIIKKIGAPPRVVTMLDGESLLNDASALVLLRSAIAAVGVGVSFLDITLDFLYAAVAAAVIGAIVGWVSMRVRTHVHESGASTAISLITPFVAYVPSEEIGASGLVASVVAGLVANQMAPHRLSAQVRLNEAAAWHTVAFLLEGAVFLIMGIQLDSLLTDAGSDSYGWPLAFALGGLAIVGTVLLRAVFVVLLGLGLGHAAKRRIKNRQSWATVGDALGLDMKDPTTWSHEDIEAVRRVSGSAGPPLWMRPIRRLSKHHDRGLSDDERSERRLARFHRVVRRYIGDVDYLMREPIRPQESALLIWAGLRGVVTLGAAQTLPIDAPHRSFLILVAFVVAAGSMLLQGGTLAWFARRLGLTGRESTTAEEQEALDHILGEAALDALCDPQLRRADGSRFDPSLVALVTARLHATRTSDEGHDDDDDKRVDHSAGASRETACDAIAATAPQPWADETGAPVPEASGSLDDTATWRNLREQVARWAGGTERSDVDDADEDALTSLERKQQHRELRLVANHAMREELLELRAVSTFSYAALTEALAVLDADEISLELRGVAIN